MPRESFAGVTRKPCPGFLNGVCLLIVTLLPAVSRAQEEEQPPLPAAENCDPKSIDDELAGVTTPGGTVMRVVTPVPGGNPIIQEIPLPPTRILVRYSDDFPGPGPDDPGHFLSMADAEALRDLYLETAIRLTELGFLEAYSGTHPDLSIQHFEFDKRGPPGRRMGQLHPGGLAAHPRHHR